MKSRKMFAMCMALMLIICMAMPMMAFAADTTDTETDAAAEATTVSGKSIACGLAIGLAAGGGAIGMGIASGMASEGIARQPEVSGTIRTSFMLSLVFIETAIIYALLVVILIIFVL